MWFVGSFLNNISSHYLVQSRILICWFSIARALIPFRLEALVYVNQYSYIFFVFTWTNNTFSWNWHERVWLGINNNNPYCPCHAGMFSIITFEEFISIALDADRTVGIYPEIKDPVFINKHVSPPVLNKKYALCYDLQCSLVMSSHQKLMLACHIRTFCRDHNSGWLLSCLSIWK